MSDWLSAFHFLRPLWLLVLPFAVILYITHSFREDIRGRWKKVIARSSGSLNRKADVALDHSPDPPDLARTRPEFACVGRADLAERKAAVHRGQSALGDCAGPFPDDGRD